MKSAAAEVGKNIRSAVEDRRTGYEVYYILYKLHKDFLE